MELKEFVEQSITQIAQGISSALDKTPGLMINPTTERSVDTTKISFDLCVEAKKKGSVGIDIIGASGSSSSVSRLRFDLDVKFVATKLEMRKAPQR